MYCQHHIHVMFLAPVCPYLAFTKHVLVSDGQN